MGRAVEREEIPISIQQHKTKVITPANTCPITPDVNNATNQSELETNASNPRKAREIACDPVWLPIGWENSANFANQSQRAIEQNQSKREIPLDTDSKPLYCIIFCNTKRE